MEDPEAVARRHRVAAGPLPPAEVPDPWSAIVARYGRSGPSASRVEVHVLRWRTSRGEQPVLLVVRHRHD